MGALYAFPADRWTTTDTPTPERAPAAAAPTLAAALAAHDAAQPSYDRDAAIAAIRAGLRARTGRPWSVTGGRGTAWGWIKVDAPPARCTWRHVLKAGAASDCGMENYDDVDSGRAGGHMSPDDRATLAHVLALDTVHVDGISIPASSAYYREYVQRAQGEPVTAPGVPYWD